jgi:hypothetical protein
MDGYHQPKSNLEEIKVTLTKSKKNTQKIQGHNKQA